MELATIHSKILEVRGQKVLLDRDLAEMYGVEVRVLNQAVKRNIERFLGEDFMFQLSKDEFNNYLIFQDGMSNDNSSRSQFVTLNDSKNLKSQITTAFDADSSRSQIVILNKKRGSNIKYKPYAFTELGVAMLSSVLNSKTAIEVNRSIMRAFVMLRQFALNYAELNRKLDEFMAATDTKFSEVYQILTELVEQKKAMDKPRPKIGYIQ
jgi:hypothetical protein